ncbi:MAG: hypothetical protein PHW46_03930 [Candidatus Omnitrophica bacterium]|nr:hypothetical protein [Candidatus Omnitrophota bacterium]
MNAKILWIYGFSLGCIWSVVNFFLILSLLRAAMLKKNMATVWMLVLVKFPVLYLVGFLILRSGYFPVFSLLVGGFLALIITGVVSYVRSSDGKSGTA